MKHEARLCGRFERTLRPPPAGVLKELAEKQLPIARASSMAISIRSRA